MKYKHEFELNKTQATGGKTGSCCVIEMRTDLNYQLKPSILDNTYVRQWKVEHTERENFSEFISATIARELLGEENVPEISLVYDPIRKRVEIASKYLTGDVVRTLDDYVTETDVPIAKGNKHIVFVAGLLARIDKGQIALDGAVMKNLKQDLANSIALSAVVGDHDVNPGNMLVIKTHRISRIARIDFGHAFNDLLNATRENGGQLEDKENPVLDFFNREKIAGILGAPSKLWRDYPGIVITQEMVKALNDAGKIHEQRITKGVQKSKKEFTLLIKEMRAQKDIKGIEHVMKSLGAIYKNIVGKKLDRAPLVNHDKIDEVTSDILDQVFAECAKFVKKNCENASKVANVLKLQVDIDEALKNGTPPEKVFWERLKDKNFPMKEGKIKWVKTGSNPPFVGSLEAYVAHRSNELCKELKSNSSDMQAIVSNYSMLRRELLLKQKKALIPYEGSFFSTPSLSPFSPQKTRKEPLQPMDTIGLINELQGYIDKRLQKSDRFSWLGTFTKEHKINAVNALIDAIHGYKDPAFRNHFAALKDGEVAEIISKYVSENRGSKEQKVQTLLESIEDRNIWSTDSDEVLKP